MQQQTLYTVLLSGTSNKLAPIEPVMIFGQDEVALPVRMPEPYRACYEFSGKMKWPILCACPRKIVAHPGHYY